MLPAALAGRARYQDDTDNGDTNNGDTNTTTNNTGGDDSIDAGTVSCGPDGSISIAGSSVFLMAGHGPSTTPSLPRHHHHRGRRRLRRRAGRVRQLREGSLSTATCPATEGLRSHPWRRRIHHVPPEGDTSLEARQIVVAYDGLSVVVNKGGAAETCVNAWAV